ncbi:MAG: MutS-related protein [Bacteroidales bacterium]
MTGANMSGKSTFLRIVGVNLVLAGSGAPVCAKSLKLTPVSIISSMSTTDNLAENLSYFHAELLRLKDIMEKAKKNEKAIIILDETMKGTYSKDKHTGTKLFLEKLLSYNVSVIIATHNLELTILEKEKPRNFTNICFEVEIAGDNIHFDYKIKNGITQNQNATFLLKKTEVI